MEWPRIRKASLFLRTRWRGTAQFRHRAAPRGIAVAGACILSLWSELALSLCGDITRLEHAVTSTFGGLRVRGAELAWLAEQR
jgi:hypothetical protein